MRLCFSDKGSHRIWIPRTHRCSLDDDYQKLYIKNIMALKWYWGIPLACLISFPWFIYMAMHHGPVFIDTFFGYHNLARFSSPEHVGKNHLWLFFIVLAAGFIHGPALSPVYSAISRNGGKIVPFFSFMYGLSSYLFSFPFPLRSSFPISFPCSLRSLF